MTTRLLCFSLLLLAGLPAQEDLFRFRDPQVPSAVQALTSVGDVDADGVQDFCVRGFASLPGPSLSLVSGRTGVPLRQESFGRELPLLFVDLNGDGILECIMSTAFYSTGEIRVRAGSTSGPLLFALQPPAGSVGFGILATVVRDLDNDGTNDLAVSAPFDPVVLNSRLVHGIGRVYLYSGATGAALGFCEPTDLVLEFGTAVVGLPDVSGDGVPDLCIGARGAAFIHSGADGSRLRELGTRDIGSGLGITMDDAGDLDGDDVHDVVVGAPWASSPQLAGGKVLVFSGATGAQLHAFHGARSDELGTSVASAGDIDGDAIPDLVAGAIQRGISGAGYVRAWSGRTGAVLFTVSGLVSGDRFGGLVAGIGDVNGDGAADVIAARIDFSSSQSPSPMVHVISGVPLQLASDTHLVSASSGGTQNLLVDAGPALAGKVYFVLGSLSGTSPGIRIHGVSVPLHYDVWTAFTIVQANSAALVGTLGVLDAQGRAGAALVIPALPALQGLTLHHAAVFVDGALVVGASQAVPLSLLP